MSVDCIAHRGFGGTHPENTLAAVRAASRVADWIEVDVRRCGSGELVIIHDARVDRVTAASGPVDSFTGAELSGLSVCGSEAGVPTLAAVLDATPPGVGLDVELKERGLATEAVGAVAELPNRSIISSFQTDILDSVHEAGTCPTALIAADRGDRAIERATGIGCRALCLAAEICTPSLVETAHEAGLLVYAWTIRDSETARQCREAGVDGLIADRSTVCPA